MWGHDIIRMVADVQPYCSHETLDQQLYAYLFMCVNPAVGYWDTIARIKYGYDIVMQTPGIADPSMLEQRGEKQLLWSSAGKKQVHAI